MTDKVVLSATGIVKRFPGTLALNNVDVYVHEGEAHALVGENGAGKSTLMNVISGVYKADKGEVEFLGKKVRFENPKEAQDAGIGFVHQELNLCYHLNVAENIFLGRVPKGPLGLMDKRKLYKQAQDLLDRFKADFSAKAQIADLTVAQCQVVEIAKALSLNCKVLILDEPTSSLTEKETEMLFDTINQLKADGIAIFYISHRMEEIFKVCDSLTVMRDGEKVKRVMIDEVETDDIIRMMVGRELTDMYPPKTEKIGETVLQVKNYKKEGVFDRINFEVKRGEILGFYGLVGAGRSELMRSICGIDPHTSGEVIYKGKKVNFKNYRQCIDSGIAYLTEDRKAQGLFLHMSVAQNTSAGKIKNVSGKLFVSNKKENALAQKYVDMMSTKVATLKQPVNSLSGGNQQKVLIGKWLAIEPDIIVMDEPTRGIDVGAKAEIHKLLRRLSNEGVCIILVSSELPEIMGVADRIIVMHEGIICGEVTGDEITEENIITFASSTESAQKRK